MALFIHVRLSRQIVQIVYIHALAAHADNRREIVITQEVVEEAILIITLQVLLHAEAVVAASVQAEVLHATAAADQLAVVEEEFVEDNEFKRNENEIN